MPRENHVSIGHLELSTLASEDVINVVEGFVTSMRGALVITPNLQISASLRRAPLQRTPDLSICDGAPLVWVSAIAGHRVPRVTGVDLVPLLLARAAERAWRVAVVGGSSAEQLDRWQASARWAYPSLRIVLAHSPPRYDSCDPLERGRIVDRILAAEPDLCLVALGHPKQELVACDALQRDGHAVFIGVGAALDFMTGEQSRAPRALQRAGLEWLWRLAHDPGRLWWRYLAEGPLELVRMVWWGVGARVGRHRGGAPD